jgi:hypothetical protein
MSQTIRSEFNFYECVTDPFGAHVAAAVPDSFVGKTVCFTDSFYSVQPGMSWDNTTTPTINGALIMFGVSANDLSVNTFYGATVSPNVSPIYDVYIIPIGTNDKLYAYNTAYLVGSLVGNFLNIKQIFGSTVTAPLWYQYNSTNALVESLRVFAAGLRLWPVIEYVTDATTQCITTVHAGLIKPKDVLSVYNNNGSVSNLLQIADGLVSFPNDKGVTVRFDPLQLEQYLKMYEAEQFQPTDYRDTLNNWSPMGMPSIIVRFRNNLTLGAALPIYLSCRVWMECVLKQPTPIFSTDSVIDPDFSRKADQMRINRELFPIAVSGHTFKTFLNQINRYSNLRRTNRTRARRYAAGIYGNYARKGKGNKKGGQRQPNGGPKPKRYGNRKPGGMNISAPAKIPMQVSNNPNSTGLRRRQVPSGKGTGFFKAANDLPLPPKAKVGLKVAKVGYNVGKVGYNIFKNMKGPKQD